MIKPTERRIQEVIEDPWYKDWDAISKYWKLDEDFIRRFHDFVWWSSICRCQKLSEAFLIEFIGEIYTYSLKLNRHIPQEVKERIIAMKELMG